MNKKKYIILALLLVIALSLSGCTKKEDKNSTPEDAAVETQSTEKSQPETPAPQPETLPAAAPEAAAVQDSRPVTVLDSLPDLVAAETIEIKGKTQPGSRVFINGQEVQPGAGGEFCFPYSLQVGKNEIRVVILGKNKKEDSSTVSVERRPTPPKLTVISPEQSDAEYLTISGQTEKDCIVYVNTTPVRPDWDGNFSSVVQLKEGANSIKISSTNKDGGTAAIQKTVSFSPPTPRLEVIIPDETRNKQVTISGITDTNTVLVLYVNENTTNINMQNGIFSGAVTLEEGLNNITVTAINKWGRKTTVSQNIMYYTY
jgi:uncharacterized protein YfaP (DUF2135 family)